MRRADLLVGVILMLFSAYTAIKSTELPIGWIKGYGPGGGAFPFWLSLGMLVCTVLVVARNLLGTSPEARSDATFFVDAEGRRLVGTVAGSLTVMVALVSGIYVFGVPILPAVGIYVAVPVFMIFYMRYLGRHSWLTTLLIATATPVVTFLFFEKLLVILLPKGITDEWFYIFF